MHKMMNAPLIIFVICLAPIVRATDRVVATAQVENLGRVQVIADSSENSSLSLKFGESALQVQTEGIGSSAALHPYKEKLSSSVVNR